MSNDLQKIYEAMTNQKLHAAAQVNNPSLVGYGSIIGGYVPPYDPYADQAQPLVYRPRKKAPGRIETQAEQRARYRLQITDPRVLAVYDMLIESDGRRYDDIAKDIVKKLDAVAIEEAFQLDQAVAA